MFFQMFAFPVVKKQKLDIFDIVKRSIQFSKPSTIDEVDPNEQVSNAVAMEQI